MCVLLQFPSVSHPQTLDRRYLGIIHGLLLDLMKVKQSATFFRGQHSFSNPRSCDIICCWFFFKNKLQMSYHPKVQSVIKDRMWMSCIALVWLDSPSFCFRWIRTCCAWTPPNAFWQNSVWTIQCFKALEGQSGQLPRRPPHLAPQRENHTMETTPYPAGQ